MIQPLMDLGYPTEAHGRIPAFNNIEEEAEFWNTHDITDVLDELGPMTLHAAPRLVSLERLTIGLTREDREELDRRAAEQGIASPTLARRWIEDLLRREAETTASPR